MTERIKNVLGVAIIFAVVAGGYAAVSYVRSYSKSIEPSTFRSFSALGEGKVVAVPDVAEFTFSVVTEGGPELGKLQKDNTERANIAVNFVKSKGVDAKDIQTQSYIVTPRYKSFICPPPLPPYPGGLPAIYEDKGCPPPEVVGYTVSQTVLVKVRDFSKAGDILSGVVESGANRVSGLSFTIDDRTKVENEAREQAIEKAKAKAKAIARAGGFRIGRLLSIDEGFYPQPYYFDGRGGGGEFGGAPLAAQVPTIEPGSQEVRVTVTLRYEIE